MAAKKTAQEPAKGIYDALLRASKHFPEIGRDKVGNWGSYGSLPAILRAVRKPLADQGIVITQPVVYRAETVDLAEGTMRPAQAFQQTILTHAETGQTLEAELPIPLDEAPQKMGATQTYFRRYLLQGLLALAPDEIEDLDAPDADAHLVALRDLSHKRSVEAFGQRDDSEHLAGLIRKAAAEICKIKAPSPAEAISFAAAIQEVHLTADESGEPVIQVRPTGPDPLLEAICNGEVDGSEIPITPMEPDTKPE